jgi:hypothetical protein
MSGRSDAEILRSSLQCGYVGGGYYNPVTEFLAVARLITSPLIERLSGMSYVEVSMDGQPTFLIAGLFGELTSILRPDELLFGAYGRVRYPVAVFVPSEERLMDFEEQVASGKIRRLGFFAIDRKQARVGMTREFVPKRALEKLNGHR